MAAYLNDRVYDEGLSCLTAEANALVICSAQPSTYVAASTTYKLGTKAAPTVGAPTAHTTGRKVVVSAITDGTVSATGTATHWALIDTVNERLLVAQSLSASQAVTSGNTFTLGAIDIAIPAPTA